MSTTWKAILSAALVRMCLGCGGGATPAPAASAGAAAVPVSTATAARADVPIDLLAIGRVEPFAWVTVKPQIAGIVVEAKFEDGSEVRAGDVLVLLDARPFEALLHLAEADLARDTALYRDASRAADQIREALEKKAVSERSADQARAVADAAQATVRRDEASVEIARLAVEHCTIRSPIDGRTGELLARKGSVVKENETELVTVRQIAPIRVAFAVPEKHLADVQRKASDAPLPATAAIPGDALPATGALSFVDNSIDADAGTIRMLATFANEDRRLWPGQFVNVALRIGEDRAAIVVPTRAVLGGQKGDYVFVAKSDGTVETRPVTVRRTIGDRSVIEKGLEEAEVVVTEGQLRLVPGARIEPKPAADAKSSGAKSGG